MAETSPGGYIQSTHKDGGGCVAGGRSGTSTGVQLHTRRSLNDWFADISVPARPGVHAPIGWMFAIEALSDPRPRVEGRLLVRLSHVAEALGEGVGTAREGGSVFARYSVMCESISSEDGREAHIGVRSPITRLYRQARVATFLEYRQGFIDHLAAIPLSAEVAIHCYLRLVVEWAIRWRGLTLATPDERKSSMARYRTVKDRSRRRQADEAQRAWVTLPLIVADDIEALLWASRVEAQDATSTLDFDDEAQGWRADVAVDAILEQLTLAVIQVLIDPTVSAVTAGNTVRQTANDELGGALQRMRVRFADRGLIEQRIVDEAYRYMVAPTYGNASPRLRALRSADAEHRFHQFRIAVSGFGDLGGDSV